MHLTTTKAFIIPLLDIISSCMNQALSAPIVYKYQINTFTLDNSNNQYVNSVHTLLLIIRE